MSHLLSVSTSGSSSDKCPTVQPKDPILPKIAELAQSLFVGKSGNYEWKGNKIDFKGNGLSVYDTYLNRLIKSQVLSCKIFALRYLYIFVHEMGHAIAYKCVTQNPEKIQISVEESGLKGACAPFPYDPDAPPPKRTSLGTSIIAAAGPLTSVSFASFVFFLGGQLKKFFPSVPSVANMLMIGAIFTICWEFIYFQESSFAKDDGDWGRILKNDKWHYALASLLFLSMGLNTFKAVLSSFYCIFAIGSRHPELKD